MRQNQNEPIPWLEKSGREKARTKQAKQKKHYDKRKPR